MNPGTAVEPRRRARRRALQALYQWQIKGEEESAEALIEQFLSHQDFSQVDQAYFEALLRGVLASAGDIDRRLEQFTDRPMSEVDQMERVILRLGAFELLEQADLPYRVVLNEAIELSHRFGAEQGHAFINGVLDKAAHAWRAEEAAGS
jgi:N utilization substance protein B